MRYIVASLFSVLMLLAACAGPAESQTRSVRGVIIRVEATSLTRTDQIELRTDDGLTLRFAVSPEVKMTPGHLREHMLFGEPVTVFYVENSSRLLATDITD